MCAWALTDGQFIDLPPDRRARWPRASKQDLRCRRRPHPGGQRPGAVRRRADQIIDAGVQLHVEATTLMYIELGKDLMLLKFLDLVELARRLSA